MTTNQPLNFGLVAARFNSHVVDRLLQGALDFFDRHDVLESQRVVVRVPGAWEIPQALATLAAHHELDGLVALGAVIRGDTPHFDYVCQGATAGCQRVSLDTGLPLGFGLLTCDDSKQAEERAGGRAGNKGWEAAEAAHEMAVFTQRCRLAHGLGQP